MSTHDSTLAPRRPNLKDAVAAHVRALIFSGHLRPGGKIDQDQLAADLSVSKLPVREALITLESEGLVENVARRGAFVAQISRTDVHDHFNVFGMASGLAAERAATRLGEADLAHLGDLAAAMEASASPADQESLNFAFHRTINTAGGSRRLRSVLQLLGNSIPTRFFVSHPGWAAIAHAHHRDILSALQAHDGPAARAAMERHLRDSAEHAERILSERGFWRDEDDSG